jgi:hypothetical protein
MQLYNFGNKQLVIALEGVNILKMKMKIAVRTSGMCTELQNCVNMHISPKKI